MCDYSLHAVATRPAKVGETLITTTFRGTSTRGFASEREPAVAVCMLPGTELAFAEDVKYDNRWIWTRTTGFRVGKFNQIDPHVRDRHHDAIEFPDGSHVLVTQLCEGQRATVLQLPVVHPARRTRAEGGRSACADPSCPARLAHAIRRIGPADLAKFVAGLRHRRGLVGGHQGHMAKSRARHRAGPLHVQVRLAHRHGRGSRDLGEISGRRLYAGQDAIGHDGTEEFHLGAFDLASDVANIARCGFRAAGKVNGSANGGLGLNPPPARPPPTASRRRRAAARRGAESWFRPRSRLRPPATMDGRCPAGLTASTTNPSRLRRSAIAPCRRSRSVSMTEAAQPAGAGPRSRSGLRGRNRPPAPRRAAPARRSAPPAHLRHAAAVVA